MIKLHFFGWVVCRLATNPDPYDDPRGTRSGFNQFAYPGEPDLDRVIRMNNAPFQRSYTPAASVTVKQVDVRGTTDDGHHLLGAAVDLIDNPVFEGRNVVIASDAAEPIYPFHVAVSTDALELRRKRSPIDARYPYKEYLPEESGPYPRLSDELPAVYLETDFAPVYRKRLRLLTRELETAPAEASPGIRERIRILESMQGNAANIGFAMRWKLPLTDPVDLLRGSVVGTRLDLDSQEPWLMDFWFGAYDRDGQSFFCSGSLTMAALD